MGGGKVMELSTPDEVTALKGSGKEAMVVVYAPWCQFCQAMEDEYEKLAAKLGAKGITVAKYRGDEDRDFVSAEFDVKSFPTITAFKGGKMTKYDSEERSVEKPTEFVES